MNSKLLILYFCATIWQIDYGMQLYKMPSKKNLEERLNKDGHSYIVEKTQIASRLANQEKSYLDISQLIDSELLKLGNLYIIAKPRIISSLLEGLVPQEQFIYRGAGLY